jgi:hypothetical protein
MHEEQRVLPRIARQRISDGSSQIGLQLGVPPRNAVQEGEEARAVTAGSNCRDLRHMIAWIVTAPSVGSQIDDAVRRIQ